MNVYFDNSATTVPSDEALDIMTQTALTYYGNPSSTHSAGVAAHRALEEARECVRLALGDTVSAGAVIFTGSGTGANNLAILGCARAKARRGKIIITDSEHPSVECAASLEADGFELVRIPTAGGVLDLDYLENAAHNVVLASIMLTNNETGAVYDVRAASDIIKQKSPRAVVHSDCVQAFGKTALSPRSLGADMISVSAHKINAPRGAAALWVSSGVTRSRNLSPVMLGGGQERGYYSGTENLPAIRAFAYAARNAKVMLDERSKTVAALRQRILDALAGDEKIHINEAPRCQANILSITVRGVKSEVMLNYLSGEGICVSAGSACSSKVKAPSAALMAFGLSEDSADCTIRVSLSHNNTPDEADFLAERILLR